MNARTSMIDVLEDPTTVATTPEPSGHPRRARRPLQRALHGVLQRPQGKVAVALLLAFLVMTVAAPLLAPHDPIAQDRDAVLAGPSGDYLLGTDQLGRDILSRVIYGTHPAVMVGVVAVLIGAVIGTVLGVVAGYFRGWLDSFTGRVWDVLLAYPGLLLAVVVVAILGPGTYQVMVAIAVVNVPVFARLARAATLRERDREYVVAAECLGGGDTRIMVTHVLPNVLGPLVVQLSLSMAMGILLESGLSFIGLGTQPPDPSWGSMLNDSIRFLRAAPWYGIVPGFALAVLLLGLNLFADSLRDAMGSRRSRVS